MNSLPQLKEDPILGVTQSFESDPRPFKVNLGVGAYRDAEGNPYLFPSIRLAEKIVFEQNLFKEYQGIDGDPSYIGLILQLMVQEASAKLSGFQTIGGTGALRVGLDLLKRAGYETLFLPNQTWTNHPQIGIASGFRVETYPYVNLNTKRKTFSDCLATLSSLPLNSVCLLQVCATNPTGEDFLQEEWEQIGEALLQSKAIPFFDFAYQGFASGIIEDAYPLRSFIKKNISFLVASSQSKNFGLYGERIGLLALFPKNKALESHIKQIIRSSYSSPPVHPARLVKTILASQELRQKWEEELTHVRERIGSMRDLLSEKLSLPHLKSQKGMFSVLDLTEEKILWLRKEAAIYLPLNGRINIAGLYLGNIDHVVQNLL